MSKDIAATLKLAGLVLALFLAYLFRGALVQPPAVDPEHAFDTERAYSRLVRILGDERPHPVDSEAADAVVARLLIEIESLGFTPVIRDEFHCVETWRSGRCARLQNIAFWVSDPGPNAVLLLSHHDSVPAGPGASDDGAGVASSLEIASLLKDTPLTRPLLVLITDGEELGLMGANLFVEKDPLAQMVGAVVNMEARGVSGLSTLIQTSRPNGRDLEALGSGTRLPAASSLNADIYELLPNDTDMTEFLSLPIDAANLAYAGDVAFYHTPGDNLANMDKRALFNLGASGLAATQAFLAQSGNEAESQLLYVDVLGLLLLSLPVWLAWLLTGLTGVITFALLWTQRVSTKLWRIVLVPGLAIALGLVFSIGLTMLVDMIRPEARFGSAYPIALRGLHGAAGLTGALIIYTFMTRAGEAKALLASIWLWSALFALAALVFIEGTGILFIPSLIVFSLAGLAFLLKRETTGFALAALGGLVFAILSYQLTALGEGGLLIESSAPFTIVCILSFAYLAPLTWPREASLLRSFWLTLLGAGTCMAIFFVASLMVPAYSPQAPRALSLTHIQSNVFETPVWSVFDVDKMPAEFLSIAAFETGELPVFGGPRQMAPAPGFPTRLAAQIMSDTRTNEERIIELDISDPDTDQIALSLNTGAPMAAITLNGTAIKTPEKVRNLICSGRACRNVTLTLRFPANDVPFVVDVISRRFGLGPEGKALRDSRPNWTLPRQRGDTRLSHIRLREEL